MHGDHIPLQSALRFEPWASISRSLQLLPPNNALHAIIRQAAGDVAAPILPTKKVIASEHVVGAPELPAAARLVASLVQGNGDAIPIVPNTHSVPFANAYFEGRALLILRTEPQQKYAHIFCDSRKNTQLVLQVQGKFKVVPVGRLFVGAEIPTQQKFSWLLKSFWNTVIAFARPVLPALHYSFGNTKLREFTHFVTPLYSSCDQVEITPPGKTPPTLGEVLAETAAARAHRKRQSRSPFHVDTESTYTFSIKCDYVDMLAWTLVRIPFAHQTPLHNILGTKHMRVSAYAVGDEAKHKHHSQDDLQHIFQLDFNHS